MAALAGASSSEQSEVLILGCGYTGRRVAARLKEGGIRVSGTHRRQIDFTQPGWEPLLRGMLREGMVVLHSIPSLPQHRDAELLRCLEGMASRLVYLSTTGVYGDAAEVDEHTPAAPVTDRQRARVKTERAVEQGTWSSLILRPAAIYGPGRGIHVSMQSGKFKLLGEGQNWVSRIHVDDLAAIVEAGLFSEISGAFPVADEHPCPSREIAEFCSKLLHIPMPARASREEIGETRQQNRRVNGSAVCRLLGVKLRYPSYLTGIPASL